MLRSTLFNFSPRKLAAVQTELQDIYSKATVDGLPMEPSITDKMATSRDADELEALWVGWRNVTGKLLKEKYKEFVKYLNIGATDNGMNVLETCCKRLETIFEKIDTARYGIYSH